jgi:uncharacterized membrane protein (UPF0127 family)
MNLLKVIAVPAASAAPDADGWILRYRETNFGMSPFRFLSATAGALLGAATACAQLPETTLVAGNQHITVEIARSLHERETGLMHRHTLPPDHGMLFVFPSISYIGMWMVDTYIPLSVAFIDAQGNVINIEKMEPLTRDVHYAARPAKYALEMNRGWFSRHGIQPGNRIGGVTAIAPLLH